MGFREMIEEDLAALGDEQVSGVEARVVEAFMRLHYGGVLDLLSRDQFRDAVYVAAVMAVLEGPEVAAFMVSAFGLRD